jgi:hypothetical protein
MPAREFKQGRHRTLSVRLVAVDSKSMENWAKRSAVFPGSQGKYNSNGVGSGVQMMWSVGPRSTRLELLLTRTTRVWGHDDEPSHHRKSR